MKNSSEAQKNGVKTDSKSTENLELVRIGQKLLIACFILIFIGGVVIGNGAGREQIYTLTLIAAGSVTFIGIYCIGKGLGYSTVISVLWCICLFIPGVNLIMFFYFVFKSTKVLKAAGYSVGLLGAKKHVVA